MLFYILFYNYFLFFYFKLDRELVHLTHDLDDLSAGLHMKSHIINELSELALERSELRKN